jgi:hypothetical protein
VVPIKARGRYTLCSAIHRAEGVRRVRNGDFWKSELFAKDLPSECLSGQTAAQIAQKMLPQIAENAARLTSFTRANLLPDEIQRKQELSRLVTLWKLKGFSSLTSQPLNKSVCVIHIIHLSANLAKI